MIRTGPPHSDTVETRPVSDLCTCCCRTSKDVSQQVVGWAQTRDLAAVKIADDGTSIGKLDSMPADRRFDRAWSWHHRRRRRPASRSLPARQNDAACPAVSLAMTGLRVNRTQWVLLSATSAKVRMGNAHVGAKAARRASREIRPSQSMRHECWYPLEPRSAPRRPARTARSGSSKGSRCRDLAPRLRRPRAQAFDERAADHDFCPSARELERGTGC